MNRGIEDYPTRCQKVPRTSRCPVPSRGRVPFSPAQRAASPRPGSHTFAVPRVPLGPGSVRLLPVRGTRSDQRLPDNRPPSQATPWSIHQGTRRKRAPKVGSSIVRPRVDGPNDMSLSPVSHSQRPWSERRRPTVLYGDSSEEELPHHDRCEQHREPPARSLSQAGVSSLFQAVVTRGWLAGDRSPSDQ